MSKSLSCINAALAPLVSSTSDIKSMLFKSIVYMHDANERNMDHPQAHNVLQKGCTQGTQIAWPEAAAFLLVYPL